MSRPVTLAGMTRLTYEHLAGLAGTHLDADTAIRWLGLLRPAVRLVPAGPGDPVVARLGGTPTLPAAVAWPEWPDRGPLTFVAEVDLAALTATGLDPGLALPAEGRLLAFYFDDPEGIGEIVYSGDPASLAGARLLHVTDTPPVADPRVTLGAAAAMTWPDEENPVLERHGLDDLPDEFVEALGELLEEELGPDVYGHQLGGWAHPVQGAVEYEAAEGRLGASLFDETHTVEALRWRPLLQVDSDDEADVSWGDAGVLYWLARTDGTTPPGPEDVGFTWQCG